jgi:uncharacterized membrane protein YhaH (DUF805 family)
MTTVNVAGAAVPVVLLFIGAALVCRHRGHHSGWTWFWSLCAIASVVGAATLASVLGVAANTGGSVLADIANGIGELFALARK